MLGSYIHMEWLRSHMCECTACQIGVSVVVHSPWDRLGMASRHGKDLFAVYQASREDEVALARGGKRRREWARSSKGGMIHAHYVHLTPFGPHLRRSSA